MPHRRHVEGDKMSIYTFCEFLTWLPFAIILGALLWWLGQMV
jgi:hypothetical protein